MEMECAYDNFYVYGADGLAYRKDAQGNIYTYNTNYRGDVISVTDENGVIKAEYAYEPYGRMVDSYTAAGFSDNFGYRGEYRDPESDYIYLRNRYLDPKTGSFTTEDPARDGLNWFIYCGGNPVKYVDPWGMAYIEGIWVDEYTYYLNDGTYIPNVIGEMGYSENQQFVGWKVIDTEDNVHIIYASDIASLEIMKEDGTYISSSDATFINSLGYFGSDYEVSNAALRTKNSKFVPRKDARKGAENRQQTGEREKNGQHDNTENHSRTPKGQQTAYGNQGPMRIEYEPSDVPLAMEAQVQTQNLGLTFSGTGLIVALALMLFAA